MSTTYASRRKSTSSQLCFDWMMPSPRTRQTARQRQTAPNPESQHRAKATALPLRPAAISQAQPDNSTLGVGSPQRVGEARLGQVMIGLLKRYGITDAEIQAGLAEYAQSGGSLCQAS